MNPVVLLLDDDASFRTLLSRILLIGGYAVVEAGTVAEALSVLETHQVALAGIAMVPEGGGVFPKLTVHENLAMAARPGRDGGAGWTFADVLELFPRLRERLRHMGGNLSGGERQMLAIGRALMTNPDLLILDEATEGLAPLVREEIWATIRQLRSREVAVLVVDKDIETLKTLADRCVIIAKGPFTEVRAMVIETRARSCIIAFDLLGKTHQQAMTYMQLRPG